MDEQKACVDVTSLILSANVNLTSIFLAEKLGDCTLVPFVRVLNSSQNIKWLLNLCLFDIYM